MVTNIDMRAMTYHDRGGDQTNANNKLNLWIRLKASQRMWVYIPNGSARDVVVSEVY